ncbi:hypothetical protein ACJQWK_10451 [Exserohilum turcicum]
MCITPKTTSIYPAPHLSSPSNLHTSHVCLPARNPHPSADNTCTVRKEGERESYVHIGTKHRNPKATRQAPIFGHTSEINPPMPLLQPSLARCLKKRCLTRMAIGAAQSQHTHNPPPRTMSCHDGFEYHMVPPQFSLCTKTRPLHYAPSPFPRPQNADRRASTTTLLTWLHTPSCQKKQREREREQLDKSSVSLTHPPTHVPAHLEACQIFLSCRYISMCICICMDACSLVLASKPHLNHLLVMIVIAIAAWTWTCTGNGGGGTCGLPTVPSLIRGRGCGVRAEWLFYHVYGWMDGWV